MKIIRLRAEHVKRLTGTVEITPTTDVVVLAGKNGQGKSTVIDCFQWALEGAGVISGEPIAKGHNKALIRLELGEEEAELIAERRFSKRGTELSFKNADGSPTILSAQAMADSIRGAISFDLLAFYRMKPREQYDALRKLVNLEVDIEELDRLNKVDYDRRRDVNRESGAKRAAAGLLPAASPEKPIDTKAILDQIEAAGTRNKVLAERKQKRDAFTFNLRLKRETVTELMDRAARLRAQADEMEQSAKNVSAEAEQMQNVLADADVIPDLLDVSDLRKALDEATERNKAVEATLASVAQRKALEEIAERLEQDSEALTTGMEAREKAKRNAIQAAKLPVEGLGFGDGIVTYNGLPLDQAGKAESIAVCASIAMAANPKLKVVCIEDASLLDRESREIVETMAAERGYQLFLEIVADTDDPEFVIEDGMVVIEDGAVRT